MRQVGTESVVSNCGSPAERGYRNISASVGASAYNGEQLRCSKQRDRAGLWARDSPTRIGAMTETIFEAAGGRQAFMNLARAWHARCLADPVVSHAFSHGYHPQHTERLAAYWAEALGGPTD